MVASLTFFSYLFCHFAIASLLATADVRLTYCFSSLSLIASILPIYRGKWSLIAFFVVSLLVSLLAFFYTESPVGIISTCLLLASLALANYLFFCTQFPALPEPAGPYKVGFRRFEFEQPINAKRPQWRQLKHYDTALGQVYIWYPVPTEVKGNYRPYQTAREWRAFSSAGAAFGMPRLFSRHLQLAKSNAIEDADIADVECPLVMFNHGNAMWPSQNMALMELLASHGYCVVSMTHPDESAGIAWSKGDITPISDDFLRLFKQSDPLQMDFSRFLLSDSVKQQRQILERMKAEHGLEDDYRFLLTELWAEDTVGFVQRFKGSEFEGLNWLHQHVDFNKVGYMGMSLGGSAASECGYLDENTAFVVNLDGMYWNVDRVNQPLDVPLLQFSADPDVLIAQVTQHLEKIQEADSRLPTPPRHALPLNAVFYQVEQSKEPSQSFVTRLTRKHASHMTFTDKPLYMRGVFKRLAGLHKIECEKNVIKINQLVLSFINKCCARTNTSEFEEAIVKNGFIRQ